VAPLNDDKGTLRRRMMIVHKLMPNCTGTWHTK